MNMTTRTTTLLIVDDDPDMLRLLEAVIAQEFGDGLHVETTEEAAAACRRIDKGGIDILLTDLQMPEIDGLELLCAAKKRNAFIQVLLLTGHSDQEATLKALDNGATDYLLKPVDQPLLFELIRQAASRIQRWRAALGETWRRQREAARAAG